MSKNSNNLLKNIGIFVQPGGGRNESLDFVAGCMMLVVIFLHSGVLQSLPYSIMHVFGFFMPWFFFKAGMFHKEEQKYTKDFFKKLAKRFVVPMCTYFIISRGQTALLWFIDALVVSKLVFVALPKSKTLLIVMSSCLFIIGDFINRYEPTIPLLLKEVPMALFYYIVGFLLKRLIYNSRLILSLLIAYLLILFIIPSRVDMRMQTILFGHFEIAVAGCLVGIVLMNALCERYKDYLLKPIIYIGKESMAFYILHMPIILAVQLVQGKYPIISQEYMIPAIIVLIVVPIIILVTDKFNLSWVLGKS